jgi:hypothetical protein
VPELNLEEVLRRVEAGDWAPPNNNGVEEGAPLLDDVAAFIRRYVVLGNAQLVAVVLWVAHCHAIEAAYTSGRLFVRSPEPECGKSLLFDVLEPLVPADPILDVSISPAALYRSLDEKRPPVVLLDEIDKTIGRKGAADSESLGLVLAILNGGYRRGRTVRRCVGRDHTVTKFPIFAPVAFAGISPQLDRAALTRSIPIDMQRRAPDEHVDEYVAWDAVPSGERLRERLAAWVQPRLALLRAARPQRPSAIRDRLAECWVPQLAIADAAGGTWPARARAAALELHGKKQPDDDFDPAGLSIGVRLLHALKAAFGGHDALWTADLVDALNADDEAPWSHWNGGNGVRPIDLANRLRTFGIHRSADIKIDGTTRKGYRRDWFDDAFARYVDPAIPTGGCDPLPSYPPTAATVEEVAGTSSETYPLPLQPYSYNASSGVADEGTEWANHGWSLDEQLAAIDPDDPNYWLKYHELRAEDVRRRRATEC